MHKGKHRFEDEVPQQQRFHREGEEIDTTARPTGEPVSYPHQSESGIEQGPGELDVPDINKSRFTGQFMHLSTTQGKKDE